MGHFEAKDEYQRHLLGGAHYWYRMDVGVQTSVCMLTNVMFEGCWGGMGGMNMGMGTDGMGSVADIENQRVGMSGMSGMDNTCMTVSGVGMCGSDVSSTGGMDDCGVGMGSTDVGMGSMSGIANSGGSNVAAGMGDVDMSTMGGIDECGMGDIGMSSMGGGRFHVHRDCLRGLAAVLALKMAIVVSACDIDPGLSRLELLGPFRGAACGHGLRVDRAYMERLTMAACRSSSCGDASGRRDAQCGATTAC